MLGKGFDGRDHVNIYSKGATLLGRWMSNFTRLPVVIDGKHFESLEGYWYWLGIHPDCPRRSELQCLAGFNAKTLGRQLKKDWQLRGDEQAFRRKIRHAVWQKCEQHPYLRDRLAESTLPFAHYYVVVGTPKDAGYDWLVEIWEDARRYYQQKK